MTDLPRGTRYRVIIPRGRNLVYCPAKADLGESIEVDAAPEAVCALVSDLPRMGAWSPECTGVTWRGDLRRPA